MVINLAFMNWFIANPSQASFSYEIYKVREKLSHQKFSGK